MLNTTVFLNILWVVIISCILILSFLFLYHRMHLGRRFAAIVIGGLSSGLGAAVISVIRHTFPDLLGNVMLFGTELILAISAVILIFVFILNINKWKSPDPSSSKTSGD